MIDSMEYLALGAGFTFGLFYLHLSQAIDWILVVILRRSSDVEALPEEELERLLVRRSDGAVQPRSDRRGRRHLASAAQQSRIR